ncbi:hypothetical protein ACIQUL_36165 [Streptomyces sp. NPDC090303]|uniref:hypothetical protein n=1 Tax=Streptomyces sp. NPDC090303 TaxID=3365960 RepID=UPI00380A8E1D
MRTARSEKSNILISPSKREEMISRQPSHAAAVEVSHEWAGKIVQLGIADRFGMKTSPLPRGFWGVYLVDRSKPANEKNKGKK